MAGMPEVAKATVTIIPNMQGAQQSITEQLGAASTSAGTAASSAAGNAFMGGMGEKLGGLKGVMAKVLPAAAVGAAGKALFDVGSEFDEMTDTIIVGTGASGQALESLKGSAMDIATTVPVSFGDAGNLVQDLNTRLGLSGDTLTKVGTQIAQVGEMTGEAFDTEAFSGAMSAWGTSAEDMSGQLDTLFAVSQSTGIGMNELTGLVESSAPAMSALGYSMEDTAAMAGLLDKAGLDAGSTMGKMSKALTTLAKDGEEPAEAMQRTTEEIGAMLEKGDEAGAIDLASKLFGTKGASQFVAAIQSGSMSVDEFSAAMGKSDGIIGDTQGKTMDFAERVELLKNQFKELLEPMGSAVFTGLSNVMATVSEAFGNFVNGPGQKIGEVFGKIMDYAGKLGGMFATAFKDASGIKSFGSAMNTVGGAIRKVASALKPVANVMGSLLKTVLPPLARMLGSVLGAAFRTAGRMATTFGNGVKKLKGIFDTVKSAFNTFKSAVTKPFNFLGSLKIPRISISGGKAPFGIGGLGEKPHIGVTWGAKGGILDRATLIGIGAGEAGKEALLPLERNTGWMDTLAEKIDGGHTFNVVLNASTDESPEQYAQRFTRELRRQVRMGAI